MNICTAYRQFNKARTYTGNRARLREFPGSGESQPIIPYEPEDLESLRPWAIQVLKARSSGPKDTLTKLMVLTVMCPDLPDINQAMVALMSMGNRQRALARLDRCLERQPKGAAMIAAIRRELAAYPQ